MEYVALLVSCLFFSTQFVFNKQCSKHTLSNFSGGLIVNVLQSGWIMLAFFILGGFSMRTTPESLLYAALYAFFMLLCNCCMVPALKLGKIAVLSLFTLAGGLAVPTVFGIFFLRERATVLSVAGILIILASFVISSAEDLFLRRGEREKSSVLFWVFCIIVFFGNGLLSVVSKLHAISENCVPTYDFLVCASLMRCGAAILMLAAAMWMGKGKTGEPLFPLRPENLGIPGRKSVLPVIVGGLGYALCNGFGNVFSMFSQKTMSASIQFPLLSAAVVIITAILGFAVYREKPSKYELIGMGVTAVGAILMIF